MELVSHILSRTGATLKQYLIPSTTVRIKQGMTIFDEEYKVVAVESHCLVIRGVLSGNLLTINTDCEFPREAFSIGQLLTLSDPAAEVPN